MEPIPETSYLLKLNHLTQLVAPEDYIKIYNFPPEVRIHLKKFKVPWLVSKSYPGILLPN
jgi:hypothetical protein